MKLACLVLAAGEGSRFGDCKQLVEIDNKPMILHCLDQLQQIQQLDLYTVVGARRDKIVPVIHEHSEIIEHANWRSGIGSSIAAGIREITARDNYDGVLIALADQARIKTADYEKLVRSFSPGRIVAAIYNGEPGVPAVFPNSMFAELSRLRGDKGAKSLLVKAVDSIIAIPLAAAAIDIDTTADLAKL